MIEFITKNSKEFIDYRFLNNEKTYDDPIFISDTLGLDSKTVNNYEYNRPTYKIWLLTDLPNTTIWGNMDGIPVPFTHYNKISDIIGEKNIACVIRTVYFNRRRFKKDVNTFINFIENNNITLKKEDKEEIRKYLNRYVTDNFDFHEEINFRFIDYINIEKIREVGSINLNNVMVAMDIDNLNNRELFLNNLIKSLTLDNIDLTEIYDVNKYINPFNILYDDHFGETEYNGYKIYFEFIGNKEDDFVSFKVFDTVLKIKPSRVYKDRYRQIKCHIGNNETIATSIILENKFRQFGILLNRDYNFKDIKEELKEYYEYKTTLTKLVDSHVNEKLINTKLLSEILISAQKLESYIIKNDTGRITLEKEELNVLKEMLKAIKDVRTVIK